MGDLKVPVCSSSFGMDDPLGYSFSIEVGQLVNEMEVGNDDGTPGAGCH